MSDFVKQFINDKYKQIDIWKESDKSKIVLVYDELDRQVYVIKYLKNKDVPYQELKKIDDSCRNNWCNGVCRRRISQTFGWS